MSAFLCSANHLNAIVNGTPRDTIRYAVQDLKRLDPIQCPTPDHNIRAKNGGVSILSLIDDEPTSEDILFYALLRENCRSLEARYEERAEEYFQLSVAQATYLPNLSIQRDPITTLKLIHCYDYQACEHEGFAQSQIKSFLDSAQHAIVRELPGYNDAPWGID